MTKSAFVEVYINKIATSVSGNDMHKQFVNYASLLLNREHDHKLFKRMARMTGIETPLLLFCS